MPSYLLDNNSAASLFIEHCRSSDFDTVVSCLGRIIHYSHQHPSESAAEPKQHSGEEENKQDGQ